MGPDQAVPGRRRGMGLKPATDGEDGPLQLGGDALGMMVGPGQIVKAFGAGLPVAPPPFGEPEVGAAHRGPNGMVRVAGPAQGNGAMTSGEFVVHGYLRVTAACGGPRMELATGEGGG